VDGLSPEDDADFQAYLAEQRQRQVIHPSQLRTAGEPEPAPAADPAYYRGPVNHQAVAGADGDQPVPAGDVPVHPPRLGTGTTTHHVGGHPGFAAGVSN
jgi:hypothetical protein